MIPSHNDFIDLTFGSSIVTLGTCFTSKKYSSLVAKCFEVPLSVMMPIELLRSASPFLHERFDEILLSWLRVMVECLLLSSLFLDQLSTSALSWFTTGSSPLLLFPLRWYPRSLAKCPNVSHVYHLLAISARWNASHVTLFLYRTNIQNVLSFLRGLNNILSNLYSYQDVYTFLWTFL